MENATKALLIAAAILVAIVLIGITMMVVNTVNEPVNQGLAETSSQAAQIFNSKFTSYEGKNRLLAQVKTLLSTIVSSNISNPNHQVKLVVNTSSGSSTLTKNEDIEARRGTLQSSKFDVTFSTNSEGYIDTITIKGV